MSLCPVLFNRYSDEERNTHSSSVIIWNKTEADIYLRIVSKHTKEERRHLQSFSLFPIDVSPDEESTTHISSVFHFEEWGAGQ